MDPSFIRKTEFYHEGTKAQSSEEEGTVPDWIRIRPSCFCAFVLKPLC